MKQVQKIIPLKDLNLTNRFLFDEVSPELVEFLYYLENTTDAAAERTGSERIRRIHHRVCKVKTNEEVGVKYMQAWEERYYDREEAREKGMAEGVAMSRKIFKLHMQGKTKEEIEAECELTVEKVKEILE